MCTMNQQPHPVKTEKVSDDKKWKKTKGEWKEEREKIVMNEKRK